MPDYKLAKIYKLVSGKTNQIYIGSTCEKHLSNRLAGHKSHYKLMLKRKDEGSNNYNKMTSYEAHEIG